MRPARTAERTAVRVRSGLADPAGIIAEGEKEGVAPVGNPDTVNVTEFAVVPFEGVTIKL